MEIARVASTVLQNDWRIVIGCFDGPEASVDWSIDLSGTAVPKVTGGSSARRAWAAHWANQLIPLFTRKLQPEQRRPGTNWLGALQSSAGLPGLRSVYLFSDLVQQAEGISLLKDIDDAQLRAIVGVWAPRLGALKGHHVYEIGSGQGTQHPEAAERGRALLRYLAASVPFHLSIQTVVAEAPPV
ncbi:MAG: hypothetical protein V7607_4170 [Solirubrobacteraceae bacterium]